jgi:hypothetical protein
MEIIFHLAFPSDMSHIELSQYITKPSCSELYNNNLVTVSLKHFVTVWLKAEKKRNVLKILFYYLPLLKNSNT